MTYNTKKYETLLQEIKDPNARDFARGIVEYAIAEVVKETEKAFGGCKRCYGKGYGTQTLYARGRGESDMGQEDVVVDEKLPTMVFCKCERGKQLEELIQAEKREVVKETRKEEREKIRQWALKRAVRCDACFGHKGIPHNHRQSYISDLLEFLTPPDTKELSTNTKEV